MVLLRRGQDDDDDNDDGVMALKWNALPMRSEKQTIRFCVCVPHVRLPELAQGASMAAGVGGGCLRTIQQLRGDNCAVHLSECVWFECIT